MSFSTGDTSQKVPAGTSCKITIRAGASPATSPLEQSQRNSTLWPRLGGEVAPISNIHQENHWKTRGKPLENHDLLWSWLVRIGFTIQPYDFWCFSGNLAFASLLSLGRRFYGSHRVSILVSIVALPLTFWPAKGVWRAVKDVFLGDVVRVWSNNYNCVFANAIDSMDPSTCWIRLNGCRIQYDPIVNQDFWSI